MRFSYERNVCKLLILCSLNSTKMVNLATCLNLVKVVCLFRLCTLKLQFLTDKIFQFPRAMFLRFPKKAGK